MCLRGMLPSNWTEVSKPPEVGEELKLKIGEWASDDMGGWLVAVGGASGGERTMDPWLSRVAWAWVVFNRTDGVPLVRAGGRGGLLRWRQSANRVEFQALRELLMEASQCQKIRSLRARSTS